MLPKLRAQSPDYREAASHYSAHDASSAAISIDREKCIKCGRCVEVCQDVQKMNVLGWFSRGRERHVGVFCDSDVSASACISCGQCASVCPVGAISERPQWRQVLELLESKRKRTFLPESRRRAPLVSPVARLWWRRQLLWAEPRVMVVQTAPATRVAIGEELGLAPGAVATGQMVAGLRALGFDYVFDTNFSADLTIMEEGTELLARLRANAAGRSPPDAAATAAAAGPAGGAGPAAPAAAAAPPPPLPMFTSCCPGWVNLVEQEYSDFIPHLSSCKSPQQMMGTVIKIIWAPKAGLKPEDVVVVSLMPCTAKKFEAARPEMTSPGGGRHVDFVLTTRELGRMLRLNRVPALSLPPSGYDSPMATTTGAAVIFGNSGGVAEAAVRTLYELVTGQELPRLEFQELRGLQGIKHATIQLPAPAPAPEPGAAAPAPSELRIAVVNGIANARRLLDALRAGAAPPLDFVEVMTCPGGCIGGGGQPKSRDPGVLAKRMQAIYSIDEAATIRRSHANPEVAALYARSSLESPSSPAAHALLHTSYRDRSKEHIT
ncbi:NADH dehydrogenase I subunit G [Monoraphidium neglectum]|uniref:NADH dehydrogenase I subunit G n=1 Tax=Monoraphidium neglectum TaxID=145388 RepID=A0A0D2MP11_9CHLO|nr:NADH dehydrogenase I subunit G [Monoraphidium neglectum]KIZ02242.1 NADH dehydrogenase I subunit G [Monoraphidium neglectum]|eukprot:XP_013901261.1 NADH dehydrogenase I subunit G [Monoraphidium neglectum]